MMKLGYARVSTDDQNLDLQTDALHQAGCARIFTDTCSGSVACADRPELQRLCDQLRPDDVLVVWRLDRLGRNLQDLLGFVNDLEAQDIQFVSLTEQMDTTSPMGKLVFQMFGALAEYERSLIRERIHAGLKAARARGRKGGRKRKVDANMLQRASALMASGTISVSEICRILGITRTTLYRYLKPDGTPRQGPKAEAQTSVGRPGSP